MPSSTRAASSSAAALRHCSHPVQGHNNDVVAERHDGKVHAARFAPAADDHRNGPGRVRSAAMNTPSLVLRGPGRRGGSAADRRRPKAQDPAPFDDKIEWIPGSATSCCSARRARARAADRSAHHRIPAARSHGARLNQLAGSTRAPALCFGLGRSAAPRPSQASPRDAVPAITPRRTPGWNDQPGRPPGQPSVRRSSQNDRLHAPSRGIRHLFRTDIAHGSRRLEWPRSRAPRLESRRASALQSPSSSSSQQKRPRPVAGGGFFSTGGGLLRAPSPPPLVLAGSGWCSTRRTTRARGS